MPTPVYGDVAQLTLFTDAGEVWNRRAGRGLEFRNIKWTPGAGLRIFTPFGAFRVDVGYNGYDRVPGAAFYDARRTEGETAAPLFCASPGNRWPFQDAPPSQEQPLGAVCPDSFQPPLERSFFRRLNFSFSLGQAF
jgi:outer membrane protein insertion porin family/translocation and assembly module TamA